MGQEAPPFNGEQMVNAARHIFGLYLKENKVPPDDVPRLLPGHFVKWLRTYDNIDTPGVHPLSDNAAEMARNVGVPVEAVEFIIRLGTSSTGLAHLNSFWPYLVLGNRQTNYPIRSIQLMMIVQWMDDTICPLTRLSHVESNPVPIKDAEVVSFLSAQGSQLAAHVLANGCDALHDGHERFKGMASPDTLAKIMLSAEDAAKAGRITKDDLGEIGKLVTYVGSMFPRKLPEKVRQAFHDKKAAAATADGAGGWDG